jgi:hypothetical protein
MDNQINAILSQQTARYSSDELQVLHVSMGWCLPDGSVFLYGLSGSHIFCWRTDHRQAVEFLAPCIQLDER